MPMDPQWDYRFPRRKEYPQDTSYWTRRQYEDYLDSTKPKYCTMVIAVDVDGDECNPPASKPVALAVWDITFMPEHDLVANGKKSPAAPSYKSTDGRSCRRDANSKRMQTFMQTMKDGKRRYFDDIHGTNRLQLQVLATHPDYQRRGYGTRLCRWGIDIARSRDMYIIVFGSPMGRALYSFLGFRVLAELPVQVKGEAEKIVLTMMSYRAQALGNL
ncbi:MAG: hypothetical protein M1839_000995 [Geoglossum umbratile]|nr:MAG: hypothetical protein M1839_000995 [Geoglossum umbratile]